MNRRLFLGWLGAVSIIVPYAGKAAAMGLFDSEKTAAKKSVFPFQLSKEEWHKQLTSQQYNVMREAGTERSGTSPLNKEKRDGSYHCVGCDNHLFSSDHKFDSGTGWPSFWQPARPEAIGMSVDQKLFYARTEEHCSNCGSHLGHIFDDGPQPTGKRHCINGVALLFKLQSA